MNILLLRENCLERELAMEASSGGVTSGSFFFFFEGDVEWSRVRCLFRLFLTGPPAAEAVTSIQLPINIFQFQSGYNVVSCLNFILGYIFHWESKEESKVLSFLVSCCWDWAKLSPFCCFPVLFIELLGLSLLCPIQAVKCLEIQVTH